MPREPRPKKLDPDVVWIQDERRRLRIKQIELAPVLGISAQDLSKVFSGTRRLQKDEFKKAQDYFKSLEPVETVVSPATQGMAVPVDVPVFGQARAGPPEDFSLNQGEIVGHAPRYAAVAYSPKAFVVIVQGTSMVPWHQPGDPIYVDPIRPARSGDYVVVECRPEREGEGHPAYLKLLVAQTAKTLKLEQHNPHAVIEIPLSKVIHIYRVFEYRELIR